MIHAGLRVRAFLFSQTAYAGCRVVRSPNVRLLPLCAEKKRLRALYQQAEERHSTAVNDALSVRGKVSKEEYHRVRARVAEARDAREAARLALEQHKQVHGC